MKSLKRQKSEVIHHVQGAEARAEAAGIAHELERTVIVSEEAAAQMSKLFKMLDKNGDGSLTADDWELTGDDASKWTKLRSSFSFDGGHSIKKEEFIYGIKRMALLSPIDENLFPEDGPLSHMAVAELLHKSANTAIMNLCKQLHDETANHNESIYLIPETKRQMELLWKHLDVDGDGSLTANDWSSHAGGHAKWELLRASFDLTGTNKISPDDFQEGLKALASKEALDQACFTPPPANHVELMKALNASLNRQMQNLFKQLFEGLEVTTALGMSG